MATDRVSAAVAELYDRDPQEFTDRRKTLAAAARDAGDKDAAKRIAVLRKPTRAAWVVNLLVRSNPDAPERVAALAAGLRSALQAKDGRALRELSARRGELIDTLADQALAVAGIADPPAALRTEVTSTLAAALADPDTAEQFASGTLTRAAQWAGFGMIPGSTDFPDSPETAPPDQAGQADEAPKPVPPLPSPRRAAPAAPRPAATAPSVAQAADEAAARRREAFESAERAVAAAIRAAAAAAAVEDRLETEVRELEDRLTKARAELAAARLRARQSEAAERKARQTLDRLPRL